MTALLQATIAESGWDTPVTLPVNGADISDRVAGRGEASLEFETATLRRAGLLECEGYWLRFEHEGIAFSGQIQISRDDLASDTTEVAAQTFESLLDKKLTAKEYHVAEGDAGGILRKAVLDAGKDGAAFIDDFRVGPTGLVDIDVRAEQLSDLGDELARLAGAEWRVIEDRSSGRPVRYLEFASRLGRDVSASAVLMAGKNLLASGEVLRDGRPRVNELTAFSAVEEYTRATAVVVRDDASVERVGQREAVKYFDYIVKQSGLRPAARKELARLLRLGRTATVDVLNVDRVWSTFAAGDTVRLQIPKSNVDDYFRVLVATWSSSRGDVLTVTGERSDTP